MRLKYKTYSMYASYMLFFVFAKIIFFIFFLHIVFRCINNASIGEEIYGKRNNIFI